MIGVCDSVVLWVVLGFLCLLDVVLGMEFFVLGFFPLSVRDWLFGVIMFWWLCLLVFWGFVIVGFVWVCQCLFVWCVCF